ncbi:CopG family transcriptional regulator [Scytonema sp. PCC 10023]|uniref:CopG family transcriptional regulator n=1 Tax=Scytonema sp. PCC 10023 TaxID=1680591 RepID=UPI0039C6B113
MSKRLDIRLPDEYHEILEQYCKRSGATKTGAIKMLILVLKDEQLLAIVRKSITID